MITAQKNSATRQFGEDQWSNMPKDKFGWRIIDPGNPTAIPNIDIIQKKMVAGQVVDAVKVVPDEIFKSEVGERHDDSEVGEQASQDNDIPEIKRKPGRPAK